VFFYFKYKRLGCFLNAEKGRAQGNRPYVRPALCRHCRPSIQKHPKLLTCAKT